MSSGENIILLMVIRNLCVIRYVHNNDTDRLNTTIHPDENFRLFQTVNKTYLFNKINGLLVKNTTM